MGVSSIEKDILDLISESFSELRMRLWEEYEDLDLSSLLMGTELDLYKKILLLDYPEDMDPFKYPYIPQQPNPQVHWWQMPWGDGVEPEPPKQNDSTADYSVTVSPNTIPNDTPLTSGYISTKDNIDTLSKTTVTSSDNRTFLDNNREGRDLSNILTNLYLKLKGEI